MYYIAFTLLLQIILANRCTMCTAMLYLDYQGKQGNIMNIDTDKGYYVQDTIFGAVVRGAFNTYEEASMCLEDLVEKAEIPQDNLRVIQRRGAMWLIETK